MNMTERNNRAVVVRMARKLTRKPDANHPTFSKAKVEKMIEQVLDAYTEEEQAVGFLTMMQEHLAPPFSADILGVDVVVDKVGLRYGQIVAICRHGKTRQRIGILDLPLATPAPAGAEWSAAYRCWRRGF